MNNNIIPIHQIGFPIDLEIIIPDDDSVKLLYEITEGLDYSKLYKAYSTKGRNPAIAPESLFRILVYGYMEGIYSSRGLEKSCNRDINFRWLLQGQKAPDHNTIARFRSSRLSDCIEDLFDQLVNKLAQLNEIKFENVFVDGTKIEANANRYTFVWEKAIKKFEAKLQEKTRTTLESMKSDFNLDIVIPEDKIMVSYVKNFLVENMNYDEEGDFYVCAAGKKLLRTGSRIRRSKSGFESTVLIYECEDCSKCPYKSKCTKAKGNKHLNVSYNFIKLRENSGENIKTDLGILYRINRSIQVEGAFGIIKQDANFRRFLMRGKKNVFIEILLMAFGFDINKLHNKTMQNRNGQLLHKQQVS